MDIKAFFQDKRKVVKLMWVVVMTPIAMLFLMLFLAATGVFGRMPSFEELENPKSNLATEIYGDNGHVIGTFFVQNRSYVQYEELFPQDSSRHITLDGYDVPPVVAALIATEDERFRSHSGIDIPSLFRVGIKTIALRDHSQGGGSTITQQLAKNMYFSFEKKLERKIAEVFVAFQLEKMYTKDEILSLYCALAYFGQNCYGVKHAAGYYYSTEPHLLSEQQSKELVRALKAPSVYNPSTM
jgi:penicillin-binding protein 1A